VRRLNLHSLRKASIVMSSLAEGKLRVISTARLNASPRLHLRPIDVVVSHDPCKDVSSRGEFRT
jgi:hypothetical protein